MWTWPGKADKHCSDEVLIALADGELSRWQQWRTRRHLESCWQCRARYHEADEQARLVARMVSRTNYPGPSRVAGARHKILEQADQIDHEPRAPRFQAEAPRPMWPKLAAAAVAVLLLAAFFGNRQEALPEAEAILSAATAYEDRQAQQPLEQILTVNLTTPDGDRTGEVHVWSHGGAAEFVSSWRDDQGSLRHAVWRDAPSKVYVYDARNGASVNERASRDLRFSVAEFALDEPSGEDLERGFMRWIESRSWRPLSLARGVMHLTSDGFELEVRQTRSAVSGKKALRVTARKRASQRTVELYIEVEPDTYRPVVEQIRISDSTRTVSFSIVPQRTLPITADLRGRVFTREWVQQAVFGRELRIPAPGPPLSTVAPSVVVSRNTRPSQSALLATELEIRYALHRTGACLGEPVRVSRNALGEIVVSGLVKDADRQRQLLAALAEVEGTDRARFDIRTIAEAEASNVDQSAPAERLVVRPDGSDARLEVKSARSAPLEEPLRQYYEERGLSAAEATEQVIHASDQCVGLAEAVLAEAWALRHLAETYDTQRTHKLPSRARWLLEVMLGDHMRSIAATHAQLDGKLGEPLSWLSGQQPFRLPGLPEEEPADWERRGIRVFESVRELHRATLGAFASGGGPKPEHPERLAAILARRLAAIRLELTSLDRQLAVEFPGNPRRLSSRTTTDGGPMP